MPTTQFQTEQNRPYPRMLEATESTRKWRVTIKGCYFSLNEESEGPEDLWLAYEWGREYGKRALVRKDKMVPSPP